jgi:molecular chaperone DnaK (HSP70)
VFHAVLDSALTPESHFPETLTCAKFEKLIVDFFHVTMKPIEQVLKDAGVTAYDWW